MPCQEVKSEKYQVRKSPPFHASDCKDKTKKGKDGEYISKPDAKGTYKWVKVSGPSNKTRKLKKATKNYLVHDNGGRPFKVDIYGKTVEIYKGEYARNNNGSINYDRMNYNELIKKLVIKELHIGQSPCIPSADACGAFGKGNSILLHISGNKYIYIGHEIYEFTMEDTFEAYYSMIGNNDVPYPVLLGSKYVYFMLDHSYLPREIFKTKMTSNMWADAYSYYFGFKSLETGEEIKCDQKATKERMKCIKERGEAIKNITSVHEKKMKGYKLIRARL
ncbi:MAG: hypothetical protein EB127_22075 [Alphaproteobacteria bacterium]|nr:hypothetical protein [Alphaproteobacteria bacterium]